jgi:hypothetical protein
MVDSTSIRVSQAAARAPSPALSKDDSMEETPKAVVKTAECPNCEQHLAYETTEVCREWIIGFRPHVWIAGVLTLGVSALLAPVPFGLMSQVEYLVALISIIVGLGLADLAQSFRELIRPGLDVKWDGLPLAWSAFVFFLTIILWWEGFGVLKGASDAGTAGPVFLVYLLFFLILYLCCAFALPDPDWRSSEPPSSSGPAGSSGLAVDLEAFYFSPEHRRWFFGLLTALFTAGGAFGQVIMSGGIWERLDRVLGIGILATAFAVPIFTGRRWAHWTAVAVVIVITFRIIVLQIIF